MTSIKQQWKENLIQAVHTFGADAYGLHPNVIEVFYALSEKFHVPNWYMDNFKMVDGVQVCSLIADDGDDVPEIPFSRYGIPKIKKLESLIQYVESQPVMGIYCVYTPDHAMNGNEDKFFMVDSPVVKSQSYEEYLENLGGKHRNQIRRAKKLLDNPHEMLPSTRRDFRRTPDKSAYLNPEFLEEVMTDGTIANLLVEKALKLTTQKYYHDDAYHAQTQILWGIAFGCILINNESPSGVGTQCLLEQNGDFTNGFFVCRSNGNSNYLKAFMLDCLTHTIWRYGGIYFTSGNANTTEIFAEESTSNYNRYKSQMSDGSVKIGLLSSIDSSQPQDFAVKPPYYDTHTKRWVKTAEEAPTLILKNSEEETTEDGNPE